MQLKKAKNSSFLWLAIACVLACLYSPYPAAAYVPNYPELYGPPDPVTGIREVCPGEGLTMRIMPCIKDTIVNATEDYLIPISDYFATTISAACTLAILLWGATMVAGKNTAPLRDAMVLGVKIGAVAMFTANFGDFFYQVLDIMEGLLALVTNYTEVARNFAANDLACPQDPAENLRMWAAVDCLINALVGGIFSETTLAMGLIGFCIACFFSGTSIGILIGLVLVYVLFKAIQAVIKALYIFLSCYIAVALLVMVSPLFIPLILFQATKSYFAKWLRILLSYMLQPMILFAYLSMLIYGFDTVVYGGNTGNGAVSRTSLYYLLCGSDIEYAEFNLPEPEGSGGIGGCLQSISAYGVRDIGGQGITINPQSLENAGLLPTGSESTGATGTLARLFVNQNCTTPNSCQTFATDPTHTFCKCSSPEGEVNCSNGQQGRCTYTGTMHRSVVEQIGIGMNPTSMTANTGLLRTFNVAFPQEATDWDWLAMQRGYAIDMDTPDTVVYLLDVMLSAIMAFITAHIFLNLLDRLPFISNGISMGGSLFDEKMLRGRSMGAISMPGGNFMNQFQQMMTGNRGGST